jgi:hypothetical protein
LVTVVLEVSTEHSMEQCCHQWHYRCLLPPPPTARCRLPWVHRLAPTKICSVPSRCFNIELVAAIGTAQRPTSRHHPGPPSSGAHCTAFLGLRRAHLQMWRRSLSRQHSHNAAGSFLDCCHPPPRCPPTPDYCASSALSGLTWMLSVGCPRNIRHQFCQQHCLPPPLLSSPLCRPTASSHKITQICK